MRLKEYEVASASRAASTEEMIETDFENLRHRRVACDVPAEIAISGVRSHHHREGVPPQDRS
jgi:hypothetical protein